MAQGEPSDSADGPLLVSRDDLIAVRSHAEIHTPDDVRRGALWLTQPGLAECMREGMLAQLAAGSPDQPGRVADVSETKSLTGFPGATSGLRLAVREPAEDGGDAIYLDIFSVNVGRVESTLLVLRAGAEPDPDFERDLVKHLASKAARQ
ncbi:hypothetical protein I6A84_42410 [Frankia sp. CNm7]|uniref:hypothetical protein n=1 Tax=Frankia nepalensis TaxID=1836974 RepID=UPI0019318591|nr:hypothetical protein [Frankia nepalensis]MBL7524518.1 hypothetical protein [Frankia nepalensis]